MLIYDVEVNIYMENCIMEAGDIPNCWTSDLYIRDCFVNFPANHICNKIELWRIFYVYFTITSSVLEKYCLNICIYTHCTAVDEVVLSFASRGELSLRLDESQAFGRYHQHLFLTLINFNIYTCITEAGSLLETSWKSPRDSSYKWWTM